MCGTVRVRQDDGDNDADREDDACPPSLPPGRQHTAVFGDQQAVVLEVSAAVRAYHVDGLAVLSGYGQTEMGTSARGQLLIPWRSRVRGGPYTW